LVEGAGNKVPKVAATSIAVITEALKYVPDGIFESRFGFLSLNAPRMYLKLFALL